jgi:hypothetical protein
MSGNEEQQRARLAYDASLRALDQQQRVLEEIRSRTGILLAAASLSASFLGARAFDEHGIAALSFLALVALVVTLVVGTLVLVPREEFVFSVSGTVLYEDLAEVDDQAEQHRYVAYWLDRSGSATSLRSRSSTADSSSRQAPSLRRSCSGPWPSAIPSIERHGRKARTSQASPAFSRTRPSRDPRRRVAQWHKSLRPVASRALVLSGRSGRRSIATGRTAVPRHTRASAPACEAQPKAVLRARSPSQGTWLGGEHGASRATELHGRRSAPPPPIRPSTGPDHRTPVVDEVTWCGRVAGHEERARIARNHRAEPTTASLRPTKAWPQR